MVSRGMERGVSAGKKLGGGVKKKGAGPFSSDELNRARADADVTKSQGLGTGGVMSGPRKLGPGARGVLERVRKQDGCNFNL